MADEFIRTPWTGRSPMREPQGSHSPEAGAQPPAKPTKARLSHHPHQSPQCSPKMCAHINRPPKRAHVESRTRLQAIGRQIRVRSASTTPRQRPGAIPTGAGHPTAGAVETFIARRGSVTPRTPSASNNRRGRAGRAEWPGAPCVHRARVVRTWAVREPRKPPQPRYMRPGASGPR